MIDDLKEKVDILIEKNKNNIEELKKYKIIKEILYKDDCFLNMNIEYAYSILRDLNVEESEIKKVYSKLIDKK